MQRRNSLPAARGLAARLGVGAGREMDATWNVVSLPENTPFAPRVLSGRSFLIACSLEQGWGRMF